MYKNITIGVLVALVIFSCIRSESYVIEANFWATQSREANEAYNLIKNGQTESLVKALDENSKLKEELETWKEIWRKEKRFGDLYFKASEEKQEKLLDVCQKLSRMRGEKESLEYKNSELTRENKNFRENEKYLQKLNSQHQEYIKELQKPWLEQYAQAVEEFLCSELPMIYKKHFSNPTRLEKLRKAAK